MLELISPADGPEAVVAAVQNGADTIYMTFGAYGEDNAPAGFSVDEFTKALRYCRIRGCRTAVEMNEYISDEAMSRAVSHAVWAAQQGADAIIVQDPGMARVLREALPDMPLWGGVRLGVYTAVGAMAAAELGLSRLFLPPELSLTELEAIARCGAAETVVFVQGSLCFARAGQCHMSALIDPERSDSVSRCAEPCRGRGTLGGRKDDRPLSMRDICFIDRLPELETTGVTAAAISGRGLRPEYIGFATRLYSRALRDGTPPAPEEKAFLRERFSTYGVTDGYLDGETGGSMFGAAQPRDRMTERLFAQERRRYMKGELRRIPVRFWAVLESGRKARFAAEDGRGLRAVSEGYVPAELGRSGIAADRVEELLYRTGGTPFYCVEARCMTDGSLDYPEEAVENARRELIASLSHAAEEIPSQRVGAVPERPAALTIPAPPQRIIQVSRAEQLTEALAELEPDYIYIPAPVLTETPELAEPFIRRGCVPVAALPRSSSERDKIAVNRMVDELRRRGIEQVLCSTLGHVMTVRRSGLAMRGDFGLNLCNSWSLEAAREAGFLSATVSFELSAERIRRMSKPLPTEAIVYGRLPSMLTDQCILKISAARCVCDDPAAFRDEQGRDWPVERDFGCRNILHADRKLWLADRPALYTEAGLWGARLLFTTESPRECVRVAESYYGASDYRPNELTRGFMLRGSL